MLVLTDNELFTWGTYNIFKGFVPVLYVKLILHMVGGWNTFIK